MTQHDQQDPLAGMPAHPGHLTQEQLDQIIDRHAAVTAEMQAVAAEQRQAFNALGGRIPEGSRTKLNQVATPAELAELEAQQARFQALRSTAQRIDRYMARLHDLAGGTR